MQELGGGGSSETVTGAVVRGEWVSPRPGQQQVSRLPAARGDLPWGTRLGALPAPSSRREGRWVGLAGSRGSAERGHRGGGWVGAVFGHCSVGNPPGAESAVPRAWGESLQGKALPRAGVSPPEWEGGLN